MVTAQEFDRFVDFARDKIAEGRADSITQLLDQWEAHREEIRSLEAVRQGLADMDAGRTLPLDEAMAQVRQQLRETS